MHFYLHLYLLRPYWVVTFFIQKQFVYLNIYFFSQDYYLPTVLLQFTLQQEL